MIVLESSSQGQGLDFASRKYGQVLCIDNYANE